MSPTTSPWLAFCCSIVAARLMSLASSLACAVASFLAASRLPPDFFSTLATAPSVFLASVALASVTAGAGGAEFAAAVVVFDTTGGAEITLVTLVGLVALVVDGAATAELTTGSLMAAATGLLAAESADPTTVATTGTGAVSGARIFFAAYAEA